MFVIELAPADLMPHSVRLFLEQVRHRLWDGTCFYRKAGHIIQAKPMTPGGDPAPIKGFKERDLSSVSFQEYSDQYPHLPYTVGFAGLPGGPGWYINLVDNTNRHGPEGQSQFRKDHGEAEPCFGTVVEGRDVIDSFREMETEGNSYLKERVKILSTQLL